MHKKKKVGIVRVLTTHYSLLTLKLKRIFPKFNPFSRLRVKRQIFVFLLIFSLGVFLFPQKAFAGTITSISYGPSGSVVGTYVQASDTDFAIFTPATALASGSTITLTFPSGTTLISANIAVTDFTIGQSAQGNCTIAGTDTVPTSVSVNTTNRTIAITVTLTSLSAGIVPS